MDACRILAISDVKAWTGFEEALALHRPDLVVLIGDLVHDAHVVPSRAHTQGFWDFLDAAGQQAPVLVVQGNNDKPEHGYDPRRVDRVPGVEEVSGRVVHRLGRSIAGSSHRSTKPVAALDALRRQAPGGVDLVLSHDPHRLVPRVQETLRPRLILKGHFGGGNHTVHGCPLVLTERSHHVVLDWSGDTVHVRHYGFRDGKIVPSDAAVQTAGSRWPWMRPAASPFSLPPAGLPGQ